MNQNFEQISVKPGFMKHNGGLLFKTISDTEYQFKTTITENHLNAAGITHGGFISAVVDAGAGTAAHKTAGNNPCVTISLELKFISPVKLGQEILVAGYPLFGFLGETLQTTTGIVSSLSTSGNNFKEIQFTAPIQPGNSGGPIFSSRGTVLGVVVSSLQNLEMVKIIGRDILPQNLNNGIKGKEVKRFLLKSSDNIKIITGNTEYNFEELAELASIVTKPIECWK